MAGEKLMGKDKIDPKNEQLNTEVDDHGILFFNDERGKEEEKTPASPFAKNPLMSDMARVSPLDALKKSVKRTAEEIKQQSAEKMAEQEEQKQDESQKAQSEASPSVKEEKPKRKKRESTLLAKCMPFIYDEEGISYAEEKPDYTLESVEDIIESAERRADERIARMYNLKAAEVQSIRKEKAAAPISERATLTNEETSIKRPVKIGDEVFTAAKLFESTPVPTESETLFDDLTARRTDVVGKESVISVYSAQGGMDSQESGFTKAIPDLSPESDSTERYEDILSHTRPVNVVDISSTSTPKAPQDTAPVSFEDFEEEEVDDFKGEKDIARIGSRLKGAAFAAKLRLFGTTLFTALAAILLVDAIKTEFSTTALSVIELVLLSLGVLINLNVLAVFKDLFKGKSKIELPLAAAMILSLIYYAAGLVFAKDPSGAAILPLVSLLGYTYCSYKTAACRFRSFKLIAVRRPKTAVTLLRDSSVTTPMARSMSAGEIAIAGQRQTDEVLDFIKNSSAKTALAGKANILTVVFLVVALFIGLAAAAGGGGAISGLFGALVVLCLCAAPTLFIADMLPFVAASEHLAKFRAAICSEASAQNIQDTSAVVVSSRDLFPRGTIKLYNMTPLSSNELEETLTLAAAVADHINSPISPVFDKILTEDTVLPEADTVKYEDTLGISGWVGEEHILIGNRSLMIAHGVRVPELEVDRKILRQGYFPVYIAVNQRACALLTLGYSVDGYVMKKLGRLQDKGVILLIDNCDPNITEQMLSDYFGFYPDLVRILDFSGLHKYKQATQPVPSLSAHGFHRGDSESFIEIILASLRLSLTKNVLGIVHLFTAVLSCAAFAVLLLGSAGIVGTSIGLIGELISLVIALTAYFALKL